MRKTIICCAVLLAACEINPVHEEPGSEMVRQIGPTMAQQCRFLQVVEFRQKTGSDSNARLIASGHTGLRNLVAKKGGNAYVLMGDAPDWMHGVIDMQAEAFQCP